MASWAPLCQSHSVSWLYLQKASLTKIRNWHDKDQRRGRKTLSAIQHSYCNLYSRFWFLPKTFTQENTKPKGIRSSATLLTGREGRWILTTHHSWDMVFPLGFPPASPGSPSLSLHWDLLLCLVSKYRPLRAQSRNLFSSPSLLLGWAYSGPSF